MSRYIDADAYAAEMKARQDACMEIMDAAKQDENWEVYDRMNTAFGVFVEAKLTLDAMPTVDAVVVVRCGECKHHEVCKNGVNGWCNEHERPTDVTYFCADGERRSDE